MNKQGLAEKVAEKTGLTKGDSLKAVDAAFDVIKERLYQEEDVAVAGFGKFYVTKRDAHDARNPQTGETVKVEAKNVAHFKAAKELKEYIQD